MRQVGCLDIKVGEHCQNFGDLDSASHLQDVEQSWNVLLDIQLDVEGLIRHVFDPPNVLHVTVRVVLELCQLLDEVVDVCNVVVEDLLSWVLYCPTNKFHQGQSTKL